MEEIKMFFEAYTKKKDYYPETAEAKRIKEHTIKILGDMLPKLEYYEVEANINTYDNLLEETAFINGFKTAMKIIAESMTN